MNLPVAIETAISTYDRLLYLSIPDNLHVHVVYNGPKASYGFTQTGHPQSPIT